ncbi:phosphotransferase enzyme family protein [Ornithinibacillus xuwenensis]|uniref:Phosphotransferase n=1 Tax=Ornithinibacillus xuwenensis TaxID=3144668 RepID=A0ABU9XKL5_9BACI
MMDFSYIDTVCSDFHKGTVESFSLLREIEENTIITVIIQKEKYILKFYHDRYTTANGLQKQGELSLYLKASGLPFAARFPTKDGKYYGETLYEGKKSFVTLEEYMDGDPISAVTLEDTYEIGRLLGIQHKACEESGIDFGHGTSWSMFGGNETNQFGDYDENELCFRELMEALAGAQYTHKLLSAITQQYQLLREEIASIWHELPKGPVQGDFCPYNMAKRNGRITGIFDYNLAGDEVLINECCGVAVYLAFSHEKVAGNEQSHLRVFLEAYRQERNISVLEEKMISPLIRVIRPFRYDRVESIVRLIEEGKEAAVLQHLDETLKMMNHHYTL